MAELGEPLLQERVPTGYPDSEPEWASGGGMLARMSFASELGSGNVRGLDIPWEETFPAGVDVNASVAKFRGALLGLAADSRTLRLVREQVQSIRRIRRSGARPRSRCSWAARSFNANEPARFTPYALGSVRPGVARVLARARARLGRECAACRATGNAGLAVRVLARRRRRPEHRRAPRR